MKRHGNLFEKIVTFENLLLASKKAMVGKKSKRSAASFYFDLENEIIALQQELKGVTYQPMPYTQFEIREPKVRKICSSEFRDRVVHHAVCNLAEPIFERCAIYDSYACRINKGSHIAVIRCQQYARKFRYYLKCDIRKFFESIDHVVLKRLLGRLFKDEKLLNLLTTIIDHAVPDGVIGRGLPIGNLTSQHFANFYLGELDHFVKDRLGVKGYVRYMDDFISFSDDKDSLRHLLAEIERFVRGELKLELKHTVTTLAPVSEGVPFLGFRIFPGVIRIKRENLVRMSQRVKRKEELYMAGRITEAKLVQSVGSIVAHVSHVNSLAARRRIFEKSLKLA
jgi:RNA-directed DNA polymerase